MSRVHRYQQLGKVLLQIILLLTLINVNGINVVNSLSQRTTDVDNDETISVVATAGNEQDDSPREDNVDKPILTGERRSV